MISRVSEGEVNENRNSMLTESGKLAGFCFSVRKQTVKTWFIDRLGPRDVQPWLHSYHRDDLFVAAKRS